MIFTQNHTVFSYDEQHSFESIMLSHMIEQNAFSSNAIFFGIILMIAILMFDISYSKKKLISKINELEEKVFIRLQAFENELYQQNILIDNNNIKIKCTESNIANIESISNSNVKLIENLKSKFINSDTNIKNLIEVIEKNNFANAISQMEKNIEIGFMNSDEKILNMVSLIDECTNNISEISKKIKKLDGEKNKGDEEICIGWRGTEKKYLTFSKNIEKIELMTDNVYYYPENFSSFENLKTLVIKHDVFFSFVEHDCCNKIIKIPYNFFPNLENLEYHCQKITNIDTYNQKYGKEFTSSHTYGMWFDIFTIMTIFKNLKNFTLVDCYYILYSLNAKIYENREYGIHMEKYDYLENYNVKNKLDEIINPNLKTIILKYKGDKNVISNGLKFIKDYSNKKNISIDVEELT